MGLSKSTVRRVWIQTRLKPHRLDRYMASNDPHFEKKAADISADPLRAELSKQLRMGKSGTIEAGGKLGMVETVTKGSTTWYEAAYTSKDGKKHAVLVKQDGTETKD